MKRSFRFVIFSALAAMLVLAGCSLPIRNIPSTAGTPEAAQVETGYPGETAAPTQAATGYPAATNTSPVVVTATTGPTATTGATATTAPTNTSQPPTQAPTNTSQVVPTVAITPVVPTVAITQIVPTTGITPVQGTIPLPAQRTVIQFPQGATSYVVTAGLQPNVPVGYQLSVQGGQRMFITIDGSASMQIYGPNLSPISNALTAINPVQISLSQTGNHYIAVQGSGQITMSVYIPAIGGNQSIPAPIPGQLTPIQFAPGGTSASWTVNMNPAGPLGYTINARAGQQLTVTTGGNATVTLLTPNLEMVPSANVPAHQWVYNLPVSGDYRLIVLGTGQVQVGVYIPAISTVTPPTVTPQPGTVTPIPLPASSVRVSFAPGGASATINANLTAGQPQAYVLRILAGQTLYVSTTGAVDITIYGPNGAALTYGRAAYPQRWSAYAAQDGDYTFVVLGSGPSTLGFYVPPR